MYPKEIHIHQFVLESLWDTTTTEYMQLYSAPAHARHTDVFATQHCLRILLVLHNAIPYKHHSPFYIHLFYTVCSLNGLRHCSVTQDSQSGCKEIKGQASPSTKLALERKPNKLRKSNT